MTLDEQRRQLKQLPSITELLKRPEVEGWLGQHPPALVTECIRRSVAEARHALLSSVGDSPAAASIEAILRHTERFLRQTIRPRISRAVNATGIILHTGLGRAVLPPGVVNSMMGELTGYCTLAVDCESGERAERDELVEYILTELTGAEAATVVNNNAAATLLVLAGLAVGREVIVSRGQLIEIGGSFRLPEVMSQSGARLVEVGATNRTHLKDYEKAINDQTAALMRAHPSNYRIVGFTSEVPLRALVELGHARGLIVVDDLGAGALIDLNRFGLPHEPTVRESIQAGADIVLFSGDKLIGAGQCGVIVGRRSLIQQLRRHPLMRALRVDKTCAMLLERTLHLFRDPDRLPTEHPTYRMLSTSLDVLRARAGELARMIQSRAPHLEIEIVEGEAFLGSGSLPTEAIPSIEVAVSCSGLSVTEWSRRLRMDESAVFGRIEGDRLRLNVRTVTDDQLPVLAEALARTCL